MSGKPEMKRRPIHPGEVLLHDVIEPMGITQTDFAAQLNISYPRLNEIVHGKRGITPDTALRLAQFLGTSAELWLNMQMAVDLWDARHSKGIAKALQKIQPVEHLGCWDYPFGGHHRMAGE